MRFITLPILLLLSAAPSHSIAGIILRFSPADRIQVRGVAADRQGNIFVCADTANATSIQGVSRIGQTGGQDCLLLKFGPDGRPLGAALFGGSGEDSVRQIAVDSSGTVIVCGYTVSTNFPTRNPLRGSPGASIDGFVCKFDASGTHLVFSTYLGGQGTDVPAAMAVDAQGDILIAGTTLSPDFATNNSSVGSGLVSQELFLAKISADGAELKSAIRWGGPGSSQVWAMALDAAGNAVLAGSTTAFDFPTTNALQPTKPFFSTESGFVEKIAPDGTVLFSTYLAGDYSDAARAVAVSEAGEIWVAGFTWSEVFPALDFSPVPPGFTGSANAFLVKLNAQGNLVLSTNVFRLARQTQFAVLGVAPGGKVIAAGSTGSAPTIGVPMFATLRPDGSASTYFDAADCDRLAGVNGIAIGSNNVTVCGEEFLEGASDAGFYVAAYTLSTLESTVPAGVKILTPRTEAKIAPTEGVQFEVALVGLTGAVHSVVYYDKQRLVGAATNAPFSFRWTNPPVGEHQLRAVALADGGSVTSCVVAFTAQSPRNDNFAKRTRIEGDRPRAHGETSAATREAYDQAPYDKSVWYTWEAPRDGVYEFILDSVSSSLNVYTGSHIESLVPVASLSGVGRVTLRVRRGKNYQIRVGSYMDTSFNLEMRRVSPPSNDNWAKARTLTGESVILATSTLHATVEVGEPYDYRSQGTIWFAWTAPSSGCYLASVEGPGVLPSVGVYAGSSVSNLAGLSQEIWGTTNGASWQAEMGTKYFIQVLGGDTNDVVLKLNRCTPPANDNFANRFVLPPGVMAATGSLIGATSETYEPGIFHNTQGTVWWTWSPPTGGVYRVLFTPLLPPPTSILLPGRPNSRTVLAYVGNSLDQLSQLPYGDGVDPLILHAAPGTHYHLQINGGVASFTFDIQPVAVPPNDKFDAAIPIVGGAAVVGGTTWGASLETDEPLHYGSPLFTTADDSVWYRWVAPSNGPFSFTLTSGNLDIYTGSSLSGLTLIGRGYGANIIQCTSGVEYRFAVTGGKRFALVVRPAFPPDNDDFVNRKMIAGLNVTYEGSIRDATAEPGEPRSSGFPAKHSIWLSWTAPTNGSFLLTALNSTASGISVSTGDELTSLILEDTVADYRGYEFKATAGTTYQISVEANSTDSVALELRYLPPPPNDQFANRIQLNGDHASLLASNVGATLEPEETPQGGGRSVWWTWRAPRTGHVTFTVTNAGPDYFAPSFVVYSGQTLTGLVARGGASYEGADNIPVVAGEELQISVDSAPQTVSGRFRLEFRYVSVPGNDAFARRLSFTGHASGRLEGASIESDEPAAGFLDASVWWKWRPQSSGLYELSLPTFTYPAGISLFTGSSLQTLVPFPTWLESDTTLLARVDAGTNYAIRILGSSIGKPFTLRARFLPPPANDDFAHRKILHGAPISAMGSLVAATLEPEENPDDHAPGYRTVWWSWTAPSNGVARFSLPMYSTYSIVVYQGTSLATLQLVSDGESFPVHAGAEYQIAAGTYGPIGSGADNVQWSLTIYPHPVNDAFANRLPLAGTTVTTSGTAFGATVELGEPFAEDPPGHTIWWKWTVPESGLYTFAVSNASSATSLSLFVGTVLTNLALVAMSGSDSPPMLNLPMNAGLELAISINADIEVDPELLRLTIRKTLPPANDDFANRAILVGGQGHGSLEGSSLELGEQDPNPSGISIWWSFTPTNSGWYWIRATSEISYPGIEVFSGSALTNLSVVPNGERRDSLHHHKLVAGTEYLLRISGSSTRFGSVDVRADFVPTASNDDFANALEISGDHAILSGSNFLARSEYRELHAYDSAGNTLWWKWTATQDGVYSVTRSNSPVIAVILVCTGTVVTNLASVADTAYGRDYGEYLFRATAGTTYYISVASLRSESNWPEGNVRISFDRANPPPNDDFINRTELIGTHISLLASNHDATAEPGDPAAGYLGEQTVWWKWKAPASGLVTVNASAAPHPGLRGFVFRGDALSNLVLEAGASFPSPLQFQAVAGVEYAIGITTWSYYAEFFTLTLEAPEPLSPFPGLQLRLAPPANSDPKVRVVETSTNLLDWIPYSTNSIDQVETRILPVPREPCRFFRVRPFEK